jgi:hypothetical protein
MLWWVAGGADPSQQVRHDGADRRGLRGWGGERCGDGGAVAVRGIPRSTAITGTLRSGR